MKKRKKPEKVFNSFEEFEKYFFPRRVKERKENNLTPKQRGKRAAEEVIKKIKNETTKN